MKIYYLNTRYEFVTDAHYKTDHSMASLLDEMVLQNVIFQASTIKDRIKEVLLNCADAWVFKKSNIIKVDADQCCRCDYIDPRTLIVTRDVKLSLMVDKKELNYIKLKHPEIYKSMTRAGKNHDVKDQQTA